ncbi:MAG: hypothetical protein EAY75_02725 [Bacteroidetes bacterium]|nr:MAG: hypothetical protein EAY75_02725 [Bacteroidota bacterium]
MKTVLRRIVVGIWYCMPVQLLLLHLKQYQLLLAFWVLLFAVVKGNFLERLGTQILFLYPEYLGNVDALSTALVGVSIAVFVITWNITTFILYANHLRFLATTSQPFAKYCINNAIVPLLFLAFYFTKGIQYAHGQELLPTSQIAVLAAGFLVGFALTMVVGLGYFFGADATINRFMAGPVKEEFERYKNSFVRPKKRGNSVRIDWYLGAGLRWRRPRNVNHYKPQLIDGIFKQHHLAAVFSLMLAFAGLIASGYFLDNRFFQLPAAASITVFLSLLIAVAAAFAYFLRGWTVPFALIMFLLLNVLYQKNIFDPRNKAYGLNYSQPNAFPIYSAGALAKLATPQNIAADSLAYIQRLNRWKAKQPRARPTMVVIGVSGGGMRSATFTVNLLHRLDSLCGYGLMPATVLMGGASGGVMGAAWYRELCYKHAQGALSREMVAQHLPDISGDLLNPIMTALVARDLFAPPQYFWYHKKRYKKDRGYAFEQKLNQNTQGWLNKTLSAYKGAEDSALIPNLVMGPVVTRDGRKLLLATTPVRFMMQPQGMGQLPQRGPDAIDFSSFFEQQDAGGLSMLSALRMNATFPYVLPNVWLPSSPVIDVMDAGFRDNNGLQTNLRFLYYFKDWIRANCGKVVLIQLRDEAVGGWETPYESTSVLDLVAKPALLTQSNLFRFQEYAEQELMQWLQSQYDTTLSAHVFQYIPQKKSAAASLSFHLTQREKLDLKASLHNKANAAAMAEVVALLR